MKISFYIALIAFVWSICMAIYGFVFNSPLSMFVGIFCGFINTITLILVKKFNKK